LQSAQLTQKPRVTTMTNDAEIWRIEFRKERITVSQARIMRAEAHFEKLATFANRFKPLADSIALAIISSQIAERLFAFEDRCRSSFLRRQSACGDVGTIPAFW
jgi:hypothetical protein